MFFSQMETVELAYTRALEEFQFLQSRKILVVKCFCVGHFRPKCRKLASLEIVVLFIHFSQAINQSSEKKLLGVI